MQSSISHITEKSPGDRRPRMARAIRSLRELLRDPESTEKAFDVFFAIGRNDFERQFKRFARDPEGARLLSERPSLLAALSDRAALRRLPEGSFGRAYLTYLERNRFEADGLVNLERTVRARWEREEELPVLDAPRRWIRDRTILMHDLFHVLTGRDTDPRGEGALLWFSQAQLGGSANLLLCLGATSELMRVYGVSWLKEVAKAWTEGRRARWLVTLPFEELLPVPLERVRELAGV
jgi:ubiquinone biosynthesis protein COQ4